MKAKLPRIVAVYEDTDAELKPQPTSKTRDSSGCYAGCREINCSATRCRDLPPPNNLRRWFWVTR